MTLFSNFLKSLKGKKILILTHAGADVDALASAASLREALKKRFKVLIGVPEHANQNAEALSKNLRIPFTLNPKNLQRFDGIIVVEANSLDLLGKTAKEFKEFKKPVLLIDHHEKPKKLIVSKKFAIIEEKKVSSTEIVLELLQKEKIKISQKIAILLACGILTDSAGFTVVDSKTFSLMNFLLKKARLSYTKLFSFFSVPAQLSERIAKIKSAKRARIFGVNDFIIVISGVSCFEADSANALIRIGADVSFVGNSKKGKLRLSARASNYFLSKTKLNLARDILSNLDSQFNGSSGGHTGAAGFNGLGKDIEPVLLKCVSLVFEQLKKKDPKTKIKEFK